MNYSQSIKNKSPQILFDYEDRKKILSTLIRYIIKESNIKVKTLDPFVYEYILLDVRKRIDSNKEEIDLKKIYDLIVTGEAILEDLKKIKINYNPLNKNLQILDPSIIDCNYLVQFNILFLII